MKKEGIPGHPEVAKRLLQARVGAGFTQSQLADKVSALLDTIVSRSLISRTEKAERDAESRLVWAVAQATGESFDWLMEPLNKLRDLDRAIPGSLNLATLRHADRGVIRDLDHDPRSAVGHGLMGCVDELFDPNTHVMLDYTEERGWHDPRVPAEVPGQTEIVVELDRFAIPA